MNAIDIILYYVPAKIIIDSDSAISIAKCNEDAAGNRNVARKFHYHFIVFMIIYYIW